MRRALIPAVTVALLALLYQPILAYLWEQWGFDPNWTHGYLVPVVALAMAWTLRDQLRPLEARESAWGLLVLAGGLGILALGELGAELFLSRSSLLVVIAGLMLCHRGLATLRTLATPLLYLLFAIPLPATLYFAVTFPLQRVAARGAGLALDALGIPMVLEGNIIHLSHVSLGVAEACSGIRSLVSLLAVSTAWAWFAFRRPAARVAFALAAVPVAILGNVARVVVTALVGRWFGPESARGFYHLFSGWVIFVVGVAALLAMDLVMTRWAARRR